MLDAGIERPLILWCLPGSMIKKVLDTVLQQIKRNSAREAQPQLLRSSVRQVVQHAREKRELVAAPFNGNWDASFPLVRVAMHPLGRGSPKDNAMIYSMEAEQAERVRHSIRSTSQGHVERRIENGQSSVSAKNAATVTVPMNAKGARRTTASMLMDDGEGHLDTETQNNDVDPDDDFDKDEDEDGDDGSEDAIHVSTVADQKAGATKDISSAAYTSATEFQYDWIPYYRPSVFSQRPRHGDRMHFPV